MVFPNVVLSCYPERVMLSAVEALPARLWSGLKAVEKPIPKIN